MIIQLRYLPVNGQLAFVFGDALLQLHTSDGVAQTMFYQTRSEALVIANRCGLTLVLDDQLVPMEQSELQTQDPERWDGQS